MGIEPNRGWQANHTGLMNEARRVDAISNVQDLVE
jgi:hypothetical protein